MWNKGSGTIYIGEACLITVEKMGPLLYFVVAAVNLCHITASNFRDENDRHFEKFAFWNS